jgi:hypothetical protein
MQKTASKRVVQNTELRRFVAAVLMEYRKAGSAAKNENLKHVMRMSRIVRLYSEELNELGVDVESLYVAILVSDLGKEQHFLKKHSPRYGDNLFRTFMDHSRISMLEGNELRKKFLVQNKTWRKILAAFIGHDGPAVEGSWWKDNYERELKKRYARVHTKEGLIHSYLDRLDQGGIFKGKFGQLNGGLRKISFDLHNRGPIKGLLAFVVQEIFGPTRQGTYTQIRNLDEVLKPLFFKDKKLPNFIDKMKTKFDSAEVYFSRVQIDFHKGDQVKIVLDDGSVRVVKEPDQFWKTLSLVNFDDD